VITSFIVPKSNPRNGITIASEMSENITEKILNTILRMAGPQYDFTYLNIFITFFTAAKIK